ncbi:MAG TPA: IPExxxVDY family protein [Flavobacterium sp.]|nr:IPExxxVDY family protein [Flavobacterium sp.]
MAVHKLHFDDFEEVDYDLIAIHTALEDYRLAYFLNQHLPVLFRKNKDEITISSKEGHSWFSRFTYEEAEAETSWNLVSNKNEVIPDSAAPQDGLFGSMAPVASKVWLLPEFRKVDYFLKIENGPMPIPEVAARIHAIDRISAVYSVDAATVKSKHNLIF